MKNKNISQLQAVFFIIQTQISIGLLALPHMLMKRAGSDGWISILLSGVLIQVTISLYMILFFRFPKLTFYEMLEKMFGKYVGKALQLIYICYFMLNCVLILSVFSRILDIWVLPLTPNWVISLMIVFGSVYIAKEPIQAIARFSFVLTPIMVGLSLPLIYTLGDADISYILPIFQGDVRDIFWASQDMFVSVNGFESMLIIAPLVKGTVRQRYKIMTIANLFTTFYYLYITVTCFVIFSPEEINIIPEPVLYLLKTVSFRVIERTDLIFLTFWFVTVFATLANVFYLASTGAAKLFGKQDHKWFVYILSAIVFMLSISATRTDQSVHVVDQVSRIADFIFVYLFPVIVALIALMMKKGGRHAL
ncbi:spore germination protein [Bacillus atrophaeus]|uniref:GerAB/ArcD/ProY family transporter n=1 Tax=Bacillus atrophaeus TaxID=1452 RepID=UPI00227F3A78|nr:endospore germination permease [Bacillus atrophaeus]MCY9195151.1 spore germination protein [Bacillus atrophaeus]